MSTKKFMSFGRLLEPFAILGVFVIMAFTYYTATNLSPDTLPTGRASVLGVATPTGTGWRLIIPPGHPIFTNAQLESNANGSHLLRSTLLLGKLTPKYSQTSLEISNREDQNKVYKITAAITPDTGILTIRLRLQQTAITLFSEKQATPAQLTVPPRSGQVLHLELESAQPVTDPINFELKIEPVQ